MVPSGCEIALVVTQVVCHDAGELYRV